MFIVKIPNKNSRSASPEDASTQITEQPHGHASETVDDVQGADGAVKSNSALDLGTPSTAQLTQSDSERPQDVQDALDALQKLSLGANAVGNVFVDEIKNQQPDAPPRAEPVSPNLDIIVAPAVLAHRYVRGTDISLIVERPERVRAVLLGVSALLGRIGTEDDAQTISPPRREPALDDDALAAQLAGMSVGAKGDPPQESTSGSTPTTLCPVQVLHSTRTVQLNPSHPALAAVHGHDEELVEAVLPEYEEKRRARRNPIAKPESSEPGAPTAAPPEQPYADFLAQLCSYAPHAAPSVPAPAPKATTRQTAIPAESTPMGRTRRTTAKDALASSSSAAASPVKAEAVPMQSALESPAGFAQFANQQVTGAEGQKIAVDLEAAGNDSNSNSSSDDEDGEFHPSEVPSNMNQGDLYLRGTKTAGMHEQLNESTFGSAEAIAHALGASIEAVDRVVRATSNGATKSSPTPNVVPLVLNKAGSSLSVPALPAKRAFVLTRPPGHHCSGSVPSGFCWVNNAVVAAMHAYQEHGIDRVAIFDIDLHHGNGTQKLVWRINEDTRRQDIERQARLAALRASFSQRIKGGAKGKAPRRSAGNEGQSGVTAPTSTLEQEEGKIPPRGLQIFYGSLHDIESFPCEDGDADLVRDASTCIEGSHGQWIWNSHLDTYDSESDFTTLYDNKYSQLFAKARAFLARTDASPNKTLILISCGFDACSYEIPGMQRHGKNVPPGFYDRFAQDAVHLAEESANGKLVSLLEGGYGDRALCSASIAHLRGLSHTATAKTEDEKLVPGHKATKQALNAACIDPYAHPWWSVESLKTLEKLMAKRVASNSAASQSQSATSSPSVARRKVNAATSLVNEPAWIKAAGQHFASFEDLCEPLMRGFGPRANLGRRR